MIVHLNGWPGVGKLTIARAIVARLGGHLVDNHAIYNVAFALAEFRSPEFYALVRRVRDAAFEHIAEIPPAIPVIMTNAYGRSDWGRENWAAMRDMAVRRGSAFFAVTLACDDEQHRQRIVSGDRRHRGKLTDREKLPERLGPLIDDDVEHLLQLDISAITATESAELICSWILYRQSLEAESLLASSRIAD